MTRYIDFPAESQHRACLRETRAFHNLDIAMEALLYSSLIYPYCYTSVA